ncbi:MAG TPA: PRD domain-containing protein, partial [Bacillota bacterium]|nr:PRD domain-containing protein [Bacillota bacterium]
VRVILEADEDVIRAVQEYIQYVEDSFQKKLTESAMLAIMDHLSFAIRRLRQGIEIRNPFLNEVRSLYPQDYALASEGVKLLERRLQVEIPMDEIGFLALHLHTARTNQSLSKLNRFSNLIAKLMEVIELQLNIDINKTSIDYARLITHLRFAIERTEARQPLEENHPLSTLLQKEYPKSYNLAWKLVKIMQNELNVNIPEAEVSYLTLHIQRIVSHLE